MSLRLKRKPGRPKERKRVKLTVNVLPSTAKNVEVEKLKYGTKGKAIDARF